MLSVCIAGRPGWTGEALVRGVREAADLELRSAVSRSAAGGRSTARRSTRARPRRSRASTCLVDYTSVEAVKGNALAAIEAGVAVVIGTSGLTADDFADIDSGSRERSVGVVASGNFSLTAAMASAAALLAARHLPNWEVIDYASATKPDVPSGTARELAERLGEAQLGRPLDEIHGPVEARGATVAAPRSTRCGCRASWSRPRSCSAARRAADDPPRRGRTPEPYVAGTLLACAAAASWSAHPRARHAARQLGAKPGTLVPSGGRSELDGDDLERAERD
jgi:4-hydroxy-tetrahydrodipicolinate reductase